MPVKYRPETGQQWQDFDREWCSECAKVSSCEILDEAAERKTTDPNYPQELIVRNATPVCTAYASARSAAS